MIVKDERKIVVELTIEEVGMIRVALDAGIELLKSRQTGGRSPLIQCNETFYEKLNALN